MKALLKNWLLGLQLIGGLIVVIWAVGLINAALGFGLNQFGIYPRHPAGLSGVLTWVLLHGDMTHLLVNTTPLLFLGFFVALRGPRLFFSISLTIWLLAGLAVWLFGRTAIHIGASGLVFGYFGFILAVAFYERSLGDLAIASITMFYYGGLFLGVLPTQPFVSWESHLFGLLAGILAARLYGKDWVNRRLT